MSTIKPGSTSTNTLTSIYNAQYYLPNNIINYHLVPYCIPPYLVDHYATIHINNPDNIKLHQSINFNAYYLPYIPCI